MWKDFKTNNLIVLVFTSLREGKGVKLGNEYILTQWGLRYALSPDPIFENLEL